MRKLDQDDHRMSVSSAALIKNCEQKWHHYKVNNYEPDVDHKKGDALLIGSAFHWIIEQTEHKWPKKIVPYLKKYSLEDEEFTKDYYPLLIGMVWSYTKYFESTGLKLAAIEYAIKDKDFVGYIDSIPIDDEGNWWISDNKTWAFVSTSQLAQLVTHVQLNTYAFYAAQIAEDLGLDIDKFRGCRLMITTKPKNKQGNRSLKDFAEMMKELCITQDIEIPREILRPQHHYFNHQKMYERSQELREGKDEPVRNYSYCFSYYNSCEYWSRCHGCNYSEGKDKLVIRGGT